MFTIKTHEVQVGLLVNADIAQLVEQLICNQWVGGSNPSIGTSGAIAQLGERLVCNEEVVGSIPSGSTIILSGRDYEIYYNNFNIIIRI